MVYRSPASKGLRESEAENDCRHCHKEFSDCTWAIMEGFILGGGLLLPVVSAGLSCLLL
jgi:hypothetical protein